jgi:hypothetical protein
MKTIIRGLAVECSIEEFKELTKVSTPKIPLNNVKHRIARSSYAHWTKIDLRLLNQNKDLSMNKLLKMFKDRSYDAIKCQLYKMKKR